MLKVLSEQAAPMSTKLSATFPELERVIRRAMAKSPNDRYASAADMRAALEAFVSASRSELTLLDTDGFRQALDAVPDGRTLITGNRAVARGSTEADARGTSHAGSPQSAMPSQTGAPVSQSAVVTSNAPASQHDQSMSPPAPSPQPVLPLAAPAAVPPMPPPVVAEPIVSAWPVLRIGWWIGAVTMVLAVGVGVMLMAGRGLSPTRDAVDPRPATPDTKGRGAPNSTGVDGVAGPATSGTPRDLPGSATPPPSRESAQDQKVPQVADSSQTTTTRTDRGPAVQNNQATAPRQTTGAAARETTVYVDVRRSDAALAGALAGALKDKGVPVSGNASTSRWTVSATVQISVRKSPIGDTSAMTADYVGSVEISDAATGMRQTLPFDGHALDFGEQVVRAAAVRRAAEEIAEKVQGVLR
jgi:hypothetical protein